jgi:hypothetical protein
MILEARRERPFTYVLKLDDRPVGQFRGPWLVGSGPWSGERFDIDLLGQRSWRFVKTGWAPSEFVLHEADSKPVLARASVVGFWGTWNLELSIGTAEFRGAGWFSPDLLVKKDGNEHGRVRPLGMYRSGWTAENTGALSETDLLVAGLMYQVIEEEGARIQGE